MVGSAAAHGVVRSRIHNTAKLGRGVVLQTRTGTIIVN
jgi:serine acetyltransferase